MAGTVAACCARPLRSGAVTVHERPGGKRHVGGLAHCGAMTCPICAPYLMMQRLEALSAVAVTLAKDEGLRHFMLVLTLRHHLGAPWKPLVKALRAMQTALRQGHPWRSRVAGYIRLLESTFGRHGHHPHEHIILSVRAEADWDPGEFFAWVQALCDQQARKASRTCDWAEGWWSEIPRERLAVATTYLSASDKLGVSSALQEAVSAASKHQPLWTIPPRAYAEVRRAAKGLRWFAVGGCWRTTETAKSDEELDEEREEQGAVIAHIPTDVWSAWTPQERRDRLAVIYDATLTRDQVLTVLVSWGGVVGPPPEPDWGDTSA